MDRIYKDNATMFDRILAYVANDEYIKAEALVKLGEYLEECYFWDEGSY